MNHIQQRGLADAALPGHDRLPVAQDGSQPIEAEAALGTDEHDFVAELRVDAAEHLEIGGINEVDLVEEDDGGDVSFGRADQEAIDEMRLDHRFFGGDDDGDLVDVRDQEVLSVLAASAEHPATGLDSFDNTSVGAVREEQDFIAGDDDAPFVARHRSQDFANRAFKAAAVWASHNCCESGGTEDSAGQAFRDVDVSLWTVAGRIAPRGDDRAAAAESSFARHPRAADELIVGIVGGRLVTRLPREVAEARGLLAVLAKVDANFLFVSHDNFDREC